jgi:hypothetical protein
MVSTPSRERRWWTIMNYSTWTTMLMCLSWACLPMMNYMHIKGGEMLPGARCAMVRHSSHLTWSLARSRSFSRALCVTPKELGAVSFFSQKKRRRPPLFKVASIDLWDKMMQFSDKLFYMVLNPPLSLSIRIPVLFLFRLMPIHLHQECRAHDNKYICSLVWCDQLMF